MAAYEILLLNTAIPQIQAAQSGDTYVVPRDIAFSAALTLSAGTANGVPYLSSPGKVLTTGSALTFDGTNLLNDQSTASPIGIRLRNGSTSTAAGTRVAFEFGGTTTGYIGNQFDGGDFNTQYMAAQNHIWYRGVSDAMILTSTGLGIGTSSPATKLHVSSSGSTEIRVSNTGISLNAAFAAGSAGVDFGTSTNHPIDFYTNSGLRMKLDTSGNLGLGVTPSAWRSGTPAFQIGSAGVCLFADSGIAGGLGNNMFLSSASQYVYLRNDLASRYQQYQGVHSWLTAGSGIANTTTITNLVSYTIITSGNQTDFGAPNNTPGTSFTANASGTLSSGTVSQNIGFSTAMTLSGTAGPALRVGVTADLAGFNFQAANQVGFSVHNSGSSATAAYFSAANNVTLTSAGNFAVINGVDGILFGASAAERARITSGGYFKASNGGTYQDNTGPYHELYKSADNGDWAAVVTHAGATAGNQYGLKVDLTGDPNGAGNEFLYCEGASTLRASIRSNGGIANYQANDANLSDRREKTNFAPAKSYLDTICAIPVQTFNYIDQSEDDPGLTIGVVAQDVQAVAPELVTESNWGTKDDPKMRLSIYQTDLQYALMKCIQELKSELDSVKAELAALKGA